MVIEFKDVYFKYGGILAAQSAPQLSNISFSFQSSETIGVVGPGGAGKTTLLQLITGLEKPSPGEILVDSQNIHSKHYSLTGLRRKIGLVFQFPESQLFEMTVGEDIAFGPGNLELNEKEIRDRVEGAMKMMGLPVEQFFHRGIHQLSQGEKRRVAIAGVLAMSPELLVLDEPTAGLDPWAKTELIKCLKDLHLQKKHGLVVVSHDIDFLGHVVDRMLVLDHGEITHDFKMRELPDHTDSLPQDFPLPRAIRLAQHLRLMGLDLPADILADCR
jgi:energy-coupling factor transport system ATP-binding protein